MSNVTAKLRTPYVCKLNYYHPSIRLAKCAPSGEGRSFRHMSALISHASRCQAPWYRGPGYINSVIYLVFLWEPHKLNVVAWDNDCIITYSVILTFHSRKQKAGNVAGWRPSKPMNNENLRTWFDRSCLIFKMLLCVLRSVQAHCLKLEIPIYSNVLLRTCRCAIR